MLDNQSTSQKCKRTSHRKKQRTCFYPARPTDNKLNRIVAAMLADKEDGFEVREFPEKGRGVVALKAFNRQEYVMEYSGKLVEHREALELEEQYEADETIGSFMFFFKARGGRYCIDATEETGLLGRLVNHSRKGNLLPRVIEHLETPRLVFLAAKNIRIGDELLYDYKDRRPQSLENHPWLIDS